MSARLLLADGSTCSLTLDRWLGDVAPEEDDVLVRALPPVLDVGCGPGRHVLALAARGVPAMGIDPAPQAVRIAARRGVPVLLRSVFEHVPGEGRWRTALLLDGNIGIGGNPGLLLARLRKLLRPEGRVLVEIDPPGQPMRRITARIESGTERSAAFPWAFLGADDVEHVARSAGFEISEMWRSATRWFACLDSS